MIRLGYSCIYGDRTRRERQRKKTVRWTVFADVATSISEAIGALRRKSPPSPPKNRLVETSRFFSYFAPYTSYIATRLYWDYVQVIFALRVLKANIISLTPIREPSPVLLPCVTYIFFYAISTMKLVLAKWPQSGKLRQNLTIRGLFYNWSIKLSKARNIPCLA